MVCSLFVKESIPSWDTGISLRFLLGSLGMDRLARGQSLASFPGSSAPEREIEVVHACTIRVPGEPGNEASQSPLNQL